MIYRSIVRRCLSVALRLCVSAVILAAAINAQTLAPGGPGLDAHWETAGKQAIGTSASLESKVWFTLAQGVMTEVYYPNVTVANVQMLQFVVVNPKTKKVETERDDADHETQVDQNNSLTFIQSNIAKNHQWEIVKTYTVDPTRNSILIDIDFAIPLSPIDPNIKEPEPAPSQFDLYVYFDPSLANSGMHDSGWTKDGTLIASGKGTTSALISKFGFEQTTNGFLGSSDGLSQLKRSGVIQTYDRAENGNIVQVAKLKGRSTPVIFFMAEHTRYQVALSFGKDETDAITNAKGSLGKGFDRCRTEYERGWADYVNTLPKIDPKYQAQFNMAAMVLKAQEDKTVRGANVASLTVPWGGGVNANEDVGGGYHLVWVRDLYHVFTAYMALGDTAAAGRALDFLFNIQQKEDGSFPQNSWLDGKRGWGSLQMDEVGYPLIMAWQLGRFDRDTYQKHVKRAADFIVKTGPSTPQERWEERPGYSPSTIAAEIAGLVCAAEIAKRNGDEASATTYLATADDWARNVERWTATTTGKYGDGNYYLRITANGRPDAGEKIELNNGAGTFDEREIVDAGFLELVRLGIKPADDPLIVKSVKVIDQQIKVDTPSGAGFYRYNHDGYGEMEDGRRWNWDGKYTGKGRLWALLSGERGQYELAECGMRSADSRDRTKAETRPSGSVPTSANNPCISNAKTRLAAMAAFANEGLMIPEQVWDKEETPVNVDKQYVPELKFGKGTGSATPLAWSMAQFIRLATNLKAGRNLDTPQVVYDRYKNGIPGLVSNAGGTDIEFTLPPLKAGETIKLPRKTQPKTKLAYRINGESRVVEADENGNATIEFRMPSEETVGTLGVETPDGATAFERVTLRLKPKTQEFSPALIEKIKAAKTSPFLEDGNAVIFYRGTAASVSVAGDMTLWNPGRIFMQRIADDLHAVRIDAGQSARFEYKFIVDGKWITDPLNPNKIDNGVGGENSVFEMPAYRPTSYYEPFSPNSFSRRRPFVFDNAFDLLEIVSKEFGKRTIKVYCPLGKESCLDRNGDPLPVLYLVDGTDYLNRAKAAEIEASLLQDGKVKPFIMVLLDPKDRGKEYWASDQWADFVANEVVPAVDKRYRTIANRDGRATLGASLGGVTNLWIGLKHPDVFSRLGGQSSSFWIDNGRVVKVLEKLDPATTKFRFYLDDGTFEGVDDTRRVNVMLRGKGYDVTYVEGETGHNWTAWRDRLAYAFIALWR